MGRTISCAKKSKKLRDARQATEGRGDMLAKLRPRKPASHHDLRPRRKVVYVYSDEDADETTDDSDEPYVPQTKTKTKTKTRTPRWKKKTTPTKMRTRRSRRPIEVELTYYDCPSDRTRAIKSRGNTKGSAAALSLGVMRAGGWQPPRAPRGATQSYL